MNLPRAPRSKPDAARWTVGGRPVRAFLRHRRAVLRHGSATAGLRASVFLLSSLGLQAGGSYRNTLRALRCDGRPEKAHGDPSSSAPATRPSLPASCRAWASTYHTMVK